MHFAGSAVRHSTSSCPNLVQRSANRTESGWWRVWFLREMGHTCTTEVFNSGGWTVVNSQRYIIYFRCFLTHRNCAIVWKSDIGLWHERTLCWLRKLLLCKSCSRSLPSQPCPLLGHWVTLVIFAGSKLTKMPSALFGELRGSREIMVFPGVSWCFDMIFMIDFVFTRKSVAIFFLFFNRFFTFCSRHSPIIRGRPGAAPWWHGHEMLLSFWPKQETILSRIPYFPICRTFGTVFCLDTCLYIHIYIYICLIYIYIYIDVPCGFLVSHDFDRLRLTQEIKGYQRP